MIDQPRYAEWVRLWHSAGCIEPFMIIAIQGLGRVDAILVAQNQVFLSLPETKRTTIDAMLELTDRFMNSNLWVLGAYEIIRIIEQRSRIDSNLACGTTVEVIRTT